MMSNDVSIDFLKKITKEHAENGEVLSLDPTTGERILVVEDSTVGSTSFVIESGRQIFRASYNPTRNGASTWSTNQMFRA